MCIFLFDISLAQENYKRRKFLTGLDFNHRPCLGRDASSNWATCRLSNVVKFLFALRLIKSVALYIQVSMSSSLEIKFAFLYIDQNFRVPQLLVLKSSHLELQSHYSSVEPILGRTQRHLREEFIYSSTVGNPAA